MSVVQLRNEDPYWEARTELACAFRWAYRMNWHEAVANHFSLSVTDDGRKFLVNPFPMHFSRVKASDLLLIDADDPATMDRPDAPDATAWGLHGGLHRNCPHARCALHVHPKYATVLASLEDPTMPPIDQNTARFYNRIAIDDDYGGMAFGDEGERCAKTLGTARILVMGNHGVMAVGASVAEAFDTLYYFERAAETLLTAYATGRPLKTLSHEVAEKTAQEWEGFDMSTPHFQTLKAILDEEEPDYAS